ncbi:hypothetical protein RND71_034862 [Anisodus tanguticus]|uniref:Uncharacterized protein n=1 Tax=Anisodus tanguticus TaxID=243964 RepID=A0AAE1R3Y9_9SOLA|nr:hypothetical protein RND71_034862 [Anisodus tanguticus]
MNLNKDNRDDHIRTALYESLGLMSEDILMNEDNEFNTDSAGSHSGGKYTHMDGQAEETSAYSGESEEVYYDEQILADTMRGLENQLIKNTLRGLDARQKLMLLGSEMVHGWSLRGGGRTVGASMASQDGGRGRGRGAKQWPSGSTRATSGQNDDGISQEGEKEEEDEAKQGDCATPQEQEMSQEDSFFEY